jgi:EAL domain-containing protein (putative c-di-GMP-specific phosphodiesterase class I)/GGDEF domain-containing protein
MMMPPALMPAPSKGSEMDRTDDNFLLESWLDFHDLVEAHPELRKVLFDPVTGLPTTPLLFPRISTLVEERGEVSLLCVNIARYSRIEEIYGWQAFDEVMREVARALDAIAGYALRDSDAIAELMISGNSFVIVLSPPRNTVTIEPEALAETAHRVEEAVREELAKTIPEPLFKKFGCYVGRATIVRDNNIRLERLVYDGLEAALGDSCAREAEEAGDRMTRLRQILAEEAIHTMVLPILDLRDGAVVGYETLSRGPEGTEFERPDKLFTVAYDADLVLRLERVCRKKAFEAATGLPEGRMLFINIEPEAVADPQLRDMLTASLIAAGKLAPQRVVLEITERAAVTDFASFRATLEYLRALGFAVAVDDAGAGYGSLRSLAEVHPEWLKIDMSLVRSCDEDEVRERLIESLVLFADKVGSKLVAEGIETRGELDKLRELGVAYGQGYLLGRPCPPFPADDELPGTKLLRS